MPRYVFLLRDGESESCDSEGQELRDDVAAIGYAKGVARELMRNREPETRCWQVHVRTESGQLLGKISFATLDPTLDHLLPELRRTVERASEIGLSVREAITAARDTVLESRALIARSKGRPYVVVGQGSR